MYEFTTNKVRTKNIRRFFCILTIFCLMFLCVSASCYEKSTFNRQIISLIASDSKNSTVNDLSLKHDFRLIRGDISKLKYTVFGHSAKLENSMKTQLTSYSIIESVNIDNAQKKTSGRGLLNSPFLKRFCIKSGITYKISFLRVGIAAKSLSTSCVFVIFAFVMD